MPTSPPTRSSRASSSPSSWRTRCSQFGRWSRSRSPRRRTASSAAKPSLTRSVVATCVCFGHQSLTPSRSLDLQVGSKTAREVGELGPFVTKALAMTKELLRLAKHEVPKNTSLFSMQRYFPVLKTLAPSPLLIPLQEALTVSLPSSAAAVRRHEHNPFPVCTPRFHGASLSCFPASERPLQLAGALTSIARRPARLPRRCRRHELARPAKKDYGQGRRRQHVQLPLQAQRRPAQGCAAHGLQRHDQQAAQEGL
jgi:hypothetical protein